MQFYFIEKKTKNFLWDWYGRVLTIPYALTDVGMGQFTTTMGYDNLNWRGNPLQWNRLRSDKLPTGLYLNCRNIFY